jgi:hypothetical protein
MDSLQKSTASLLKENPRRWTYTPFKIEWREEPAKIDKYSMALFWSLQLADVWTTNRGMDYSCVYEANPLLPKVPHLDRLVIHKVVFTYPFYDMYSSNQLTYDDMMWPILLSMYVVNNNLQVINKAKRQCSKR